MSSSHDHRKPWSFVAVTTVALAAVFFAPSLAYAGSTWSRATGEAKELQRTTKDLRNRLSRLYPYDPATGYAVALDELAKRLIDHTRNETPVLLLESDLNRFDSLYQKMRLIVAANHSLATDRNVSRYSVDIGKRFDYLVKDIRRAVPQVPAYVVQPYVVPREAGYRGLPPQFTPHEPTPNCPTPSTSFHHEYNQTQSPPRISVDIALPRISL